MKSLNKNLLSQKKATENLNSSDHLLVANLRSVSLENLVRAKLAVLFEQKKREGIEFNGLYQIVLEQVEKPLIELTLESTGGNQIKAASILGINRNTLRKKMCRYGIQ